MRTHPLQACASMLGSSAAQEKVAADYVCRNRKRSNFSVIEVVRFDNALPRYCNIPFSQRGSCLQNAVHEKSDPVSIFVVDWARQLFLVLQLIDKHIL